MLTEIFLVVISLLVVSVLILVISQRKGKHDEQLNERLIRLETEISRLDSLLREEWSRSREETRNSFRENREELNQSFGLLSDNLWRRLDELVSRHDQIRIETSNHLKEIRDTVEKKLTGLQEDNNRKLEEMRQTVDEKLHDALEKRLSESFRLVSERLEQVHKGLGEMQSIASEVGDLKKVLSNVKTKGLIGEYQLGAILENILAPGQYQKNVKTRQGASEFVEYAIVLPGKDEGGKPVLLPIDSKFPTEAYQRLLDAYEKADPNEIKRYSVELQRAIKSAAKDIHDKYLDPPYTTDFGIMFLPFEGLYAEVVRDTNLVEELSREYKVIVSGPTTLAALFNSLQMGFRTLTIEKRSSEVWRVLQAVKTEFGKFEETLRKAKERIDKAGQEIDQLVGTRTRRIRNRLNNLNELPEAEANRLLNGGEIDTVEDGSDS
ncbi:MAG: DNA recombination protein RmuC [Bacteroidales bacterium]|jgi:DNA recombination protein RmuC|nr:DNA recombination protein RmuC [Bacteroidales bacterium]NPV36263.1 DNA recombination protein RmuC [Bacteroidales bacterium]